MMGVTMPRWSIDISPLPAAMAQSEPLGPNAGELAAPPRSRRSRAARDAIGMRMRFPLVSMPARTALSPETAISRKSVVPAGPATATVPSSVRATTPPVWATKPVAPAGSASGFTSGHASRG